MKPTRNRVMCPDCGRPKMLFESMEKAQRFIEWNGNDLPYGGESLRPYHCPACCGWHISHREYRERKRNKTDKLIEAFHMDVENRKKKLEKASEAYLREAERIFKDIPDEAKDLKTKKEFKAYIKEYFQNGGITDQGGRIFSELVKEWRRFHTYILTTNNHDKE